MSDVLDEAKREVEAFRLRLEKASDQGQVELHVRLDLCSMLLALAEVALSAHEVVASAAPEGPR